MLLPCPFCECEAIRVEGVRGSRCVSYIQCSVCEAIGEKFEDKLPDISKRESIEAWNTRPSQWIPAKDKMPEEDGRYLVVEDHHYTWVGVSSMREGKFDMPIKYWQPLPDLPKE